MSASTSQPVRFPCPKCGRILAAEQILSGTEQLCPHCRTLVLVPAKSQTSQASPPVQGKEKNASETAPPQPPPAPPKQAATDDDDMWGPGEAAPQEQQAYVPVLCRVCDTRMYATTQQIGTEVTCPDCGAKTKVRPIAGKSLATAPMLQPGEEYELSEPAPALTLETLGYGAQEDQGKETAYDTDSLAATARADQAIRRARNAPAKNWMLRGVYLYPLRVSVWSYALLIASLGTAFVFVVGWIDFLSGIQVAAIASVFMVVIAATIATFAGGYLGALLVAVIEVASDGQAEIQDELDLQFADRVFRFLFIVSAWVCAAAPGTLIDFFAGAPEAWQLIAPLNISLFSLLSLWLFLPWTQLSVLEASSLVVPISYLVLKSARRRPLAWLAFYGMSTLVLVVSFGLMYAVSFLTGFIALWINLWLGVMILVIYYRLLGRLAWYCAAYTDPLKERKKADPYEPLYP